MTHQSKLYLRIILCYRKLHFIKVGQKRFSIQYSYMLAINNNFNSVIFISKFSDFSYNKKNWLTIHYQIRAGEKSIFKQFC